MDAEMTMRVINDDTLKTGMPHIRYVFGTCAKSCNQTKVLNETGVTG